MGEIMVHLENCNCIKKADIKIEEGTLNIKYGPNGTGKSTISKAILLKATGDENQLQSLRPYMAKESEETIVSGLNFNKVMVFNEGYVNSYLFEDNSFLENSFKVFLKSDECEKLSKNIAELLEKLQGIFEKNDAIKNLEIFLPKYEEIVKYNNGEISKKGGVGEFLKGNGAGFDKYTELQPYKVFYSQDMASVSKWAKWRNDGIKQMKDDACPFCAEHLKEDIDKQNDVISKVFKNSALSTANAVLEYLQEAVDKNYIKEEAVTILNEYINSVGKEDSLVSELKSLAIETDYLCSKINKICIFRPMNVTHEQLENIEKCLDEMIIDKRQISKFYCTEFIYSMVDDVENNIKELKIQTGNMKVAELDKHLSWGEKNAFSLVMFMFEAISEKADLIVLDDPITSFDKDKKFAVIRRMFDNKKMSFSNKTVLMLTHEIQPLVDYVHNNLFKQMGLTTHVRANLIQNDKGIVNEYDVEEDDLINIVEFSKTVACDDEKSMAVRVVNLRKYIEMTKPNFSESEIYEVVSNLIHGRKEATKVDGETKLEQQVIDRGMQEIEYYLGNLTYDELIELVDSKKLYDLINCCDKYEQILATRLLFERYKGMLVKLRKAYPATCKFVNETNHVENDYVFQLNPLRYFEIPELYLKEIKKFLEEQKSVIENGFAEE